MEWVHSNEMLLWWLASASAFTFLVTLVAVPVLVTRIPHDYFARERRQAAPLIGLPTALQWLLGLLKSLLGLVLVIMGVLMLVLPGQGIITILIGLTLLNFPGKFRLEKAIVRQPPVHRSINWLRRRAGRQPLLLDPPVVAPSWR